MKRIVVLLIGFVAVAGSAIAQCLPCTPPDPADYGNVAGFYPPADTAYINSAYDREIKIVFPKDTVNGPITARFTEFQILSITNVPAGLDLVLDDADSIYVPANNNTPAVACGHICGTPTTANLATDSVQIELNAKTNLGLEGQTTAKYHLRVLEDQVSKGKGWDKGLKFEVYPNPATSFATLHYAVDYVTDVNVSILDMSGRMVHTFSRRAQVPGDYYLNLMEQPLTNGIYLIRIATGKGVATQKLVVNE